MDKKYNILSFVTIILILKIILVLLINNLFVFSTIEENNFNSYREDVFNITNTSFIISNDDNIQLNLEMKTNFNSYKRVEYALFSTSKTQITRGDFICSKKCNVTIDIEKVIFEDYTIIFTYEKEDNVYRFESELDLDFTFFENNLYYFIFKNNYNLYKSDFKDSFEIDFIINSSLEEEIVYFIEVLDKDSNIMGSSQEFKCKGVCEKELQISPPFILSTYLVKVHSRIGSSSYEFDLVFEDIKSDLEMDLEVELNQTSQVQNSSENILFNSNFGIINSKGNSQNPQVNMITRNRNVEKISFEKSRINEVFTNRPNLISEVADFEFLFQRGPVKNISVKNARFEEILIGYEEVPLSLVRRYGFNTNNAFAIDPHFNEDVLEFEVTFVATANAVYKCVDYDFENQNCFGEFEFLMNTIPGREYTITLLPQDPLFLQVENYVLSPTNAQCQSLGGGFDLNNCQDTSLSGSRNCPAGTTGEALFCDDGVVEQHNVRRDDPAGVRSFFQDISQDRCENIISVEVLYKVSWGSTRGTRTISISRDGNSWTTVATNPTLSPSGDLSIDVTNSLTTPWNCEDFFSTSSNAAIEAFWQITGGNPNQVLSMEVDTLVYRVTYEYETFPLDTDKNSYRQGELVLINGVDIWDENSDIVIEIISPLNEVISSFEVLTNSLGEFSTNYTLNDYAILGNYSIFVFQKDETSINATANFSVIQRIPNVFATRFFYAPGESALFEGSNFIRNEFVDIELFTPTGLKDLTFSDSILTTSDGTFEYEYQIPSNLSINTGNYEFFFTERNNSAFSDNSLFNIIFRPNVASNGALALVNQSDGNSFNVGGAGGTDTLQVGFPPTLEDDGTINLDSFELNMIYSTAGSTTRVIEWLNPSTSTYEVVCNVPDSSSISTFICNMTIQAQQFDSFNNFNIRLREEGGPSINWFVDFLYITRNFSIIDDSDSLQLVLHRQKNIQGNNTIFNLQLQNRDGVRTPLGKSLFVYFFASNYYLIEDLDISFGDYFSTSISNIEIMALGVDGTLYTIELFPDTTFNSVFDRYIDVFNSTNSANISITFSPNIEFIENSNIYYVGFDPILVR